MELTLGDHVNHPISVDISELEHGLRFDFFSRYEAERIKASLFITTR